jgi:hypothetical protein
MISWIAPLIAQGSGRKRPEAQDGMPEAFISSWVPRWVDHGHRAFPWPTRWRAPVQPLLRAPGMGDGRRRLLPQLRNGVVGLSEPGLGGHHEGRAER